MSGNASAFAAAKKRREEEKAAEEARNNFSGGNFEDVPYNPLVTNGWKGVRLLGGPIDDPNRSSTDGKLVSSSMILGDNQKKFRVTWDSNENWILWKVMNLVLAGKYNAQKKARDYDNAERCPSIFNRVHKNDNVQNPFENGWYPTKYVVINHIDLLDLAFHEEAGTTKILSKKMSPPKPGQDRAFFERGIPYTLYTEIWDKIVEFRDDWEFYNIAIKKLKEKPYYMAYHADSSDLAMYLEKEDLNLLSILRDPNLNAQVESMVQNLKRIDIDRITRVTSYTKIKNRLGGFIKQVDEFFGKNFYEELEAEAEREKAEWEAEKAQQEDEAANTPDPTYSAPAPQAAPAPQTPPTVEHYQAPQAPPVAPAPQPTPVAQAPAQPTSAPAGRTAEAPMRSAPTQELIPGVDLTGLNPGYNGIAYLSPAEKALIRGVGSDGELDYHSQTPDGQAVQLYRCDCGKLSPGTFTRCPACSAVFQ